MHTVFALLCFVVVIHWLIFPYPSGLLHWHCGNLTIAPVPAKQPWWIWINTSWEFIMNDCITTTKQSTTKPCAYFLGYTVSGQSTHSSPQGDWNVPHSVLTLYLSLVDFTLRTWWTDMVFSFALFCSNFRDQTMTSGQNCWISKRNSLMSIVFESRLCPRNWPSLVHIMACRLSCAEPLSGSVRNYLGTGPWKHEVDIPSTDGAQWV